MHSKSVFIVTIFILLLGTNAFAEHAKPMGTSEFSTRSESGKSFQLQIASKPIQTMQAQHVTITATDENGATVNGADISCALKMPSMAMAKNTPPVKETPLEGTYKSVFLFTMGGDWSVICTAEYDNQATETIVFDINDVPYGKMADGKHDINKMLGEKDMHNMKDMSQ